MGRVNSISNASKAISGTYSIMFDGQIYSSIPSSVTGSNLANLLQSYSNFGYVNVNRTGECYRYEYTIQWLVNGEQPIISISNSSQIQPPNTPITISSIRDGYSINSFYQIPNDILRTFHQTRQVISFLFFLLYFYNKLNRLKLLLVVIHHIVHN